MSKADIFDDQLRSWLQDHAQAEIPTGIRDRALPANDWPATSTGGSCSHRESLGRRSAFGDATGAAAAACARRHRGGRFQHFCSEPCCSRWASPGPTPAARNDPPANALESDGGRLLYDRDGDIVPGIRGRHPGARVLIDGAPSADSDWRVLYPRARGMGPGRESTSSTFEYGPTGVITHVADATGQTVGTWERTRRAVDRSFDSPPQWSPPTRDTKATNVLTWWSPDSTMLATLPMDRHRGDHLRDRRTGVVTT